VEGKLRGRFGLHRAIGTDSPNGRNDRILVPEDPLATED
jgi:hypothetical protein